MPKYKNPTQTVITVGSTRVEPGQTIETKVFEPQATAVGLQVLSSLPFFDNVIYSAKITGPTTVAVPQSLTGNYRISMYVPPVATNEATVKLNGGESVARIIGAGDVVAYSCMVRSIDNIIVTAVTGALYVTIEAI